MVWDRNTQELYRLVRYHRVSPTAFGLKTLDRGEWIDFFFFFYIAYIAIVCVCVFPYTSPSTKKRVLGGIIDGKSLGTALNGRGAMLKYVRRISGQASRTQ